MAKKTLEVRRQEVLNYGKFNGEFNLVSIDNDNKKGMFLHTVCNREFFHGLGTFKGRQRCTKCSKENQVYRRGKKKSPEEFKSQIEVLGNSEYELLTDYIGYNENVTLLHKTCNNSFEIVANEFTSNNRRCPKCAIDWQLKYKTIDELKTEVYNLEKDNYSVLSTEYFSIHKDIKFIHNICGNVFDLRFSSFIYDNHRCPFCSPTKPKTHEEIVTLIHEQTNGDYEVLGNFERMNDTILIKHSCGHEFTPTMTNFLGLKQTRCPNCFKHERSKGEKAISEILNKFNILFEEEFKDQRCKRKRPLPFDFSIKTKSKTILIEYDGIQHRDANYGFGKTSEEKLLKFEETQFNDKIKTAFAESFKREFVLVRYNDLQTFDEIEILLKQLLQTYNLIKEQI